VLSDVTQPFVIADIPGLVPGAHEGKGLGMQFLKHIERTKILLHVLDVSQHSSFLTITEGAELPNGEELYQAALNQYELLEHELISFSEELIKKPRALVFAKIDLPLNAKAFESGGRLSKKLGIPVWGISAHTTFGLKELSAGLSQLVFDYRSALTKS
jgi:GTP-binding protein